MSFEWGGSSLDALQWCALTVLRSCAVPALLPASPTLSMHDTGLGVDFLHPVTWPCVRTGWRGRQVSEYGCNCMHDFSAQASSIQLRRRQCILTSWWQTRLLFSQFNFYHISCSCQVVSAEGGTIDSYAHHVGLLTALHLA